MWASQRESTGRPSAADPDRRLETYLTLRQRRDGSQQDRVSTQGSAGTAPRVSIESFGGEGDSAVRRASKSDHATTLVRSAFTLRFKDHLLERQYWHSRHLGLKLMLRHMLWAWALCWGVHTASLVLHPTEPEFVKDMAVNAQLDTDSPLFQTNKGSARVWIGAACGITCAVALMAALLTHSKTHYTHTITTMRILVMVCTVAQGVVVGEVLGRIRPVFEFCAALAFGLASGVSFVALAAVTAAIGALWGLLYARADDNGASDVQATTMLLALGAIFVLMLHYTTEFRSRLDFCLQLSLALDQQNVVEVISNMLPAHVASKLAATGSPDHIADEEYDDAVILFVEIHGASDMLHSLPPGQFITALNNVVSTIDMIAERMEVSKIEAVENVYVAAALSRPHEKSSEEDNIERAHRVARMALRILRLSQAWRYRSSHEPAQLGVRMGIACGPVAAGVIGTHKYTYQLFGDTMNLTSRMLSLSDSATIRVTAPMAERLGNFFDMSEKHTVEVKGKGPVDTYLLFKERNPSRRLSGELPSEQILLNTQALAEAELLLDEQMSAAHTMVGLYTNLGSSEKAGDKLVNRVAKMIGQPNADHNLGVTKMVASLSALANRTSAQGVLGQPGPAPAASLANQLGQYLQSVAEQRSQQAAQIQLETFKRNARFIAAVPLHPLTLAFSSPEDLLRVRRMVCCGCRCGTAPPSKEGSKGNSAGGSSSAGGGGGCCECGPLVALGTALRAIFCGMGTLFSKDDLISEEFDHAQRSRALRLQLPGVERIASRTSLRRGGAFGLGSMLHLRPRSAAAKDLEHGANAGGGEGRNRASSGSEGRRGKHRSQRLEEQRQSLKSSAGGSALSMNADELAVGIGGGGGSGGARHSLRSMGSSGRAKVDVAPIAMGTRTIDPGHEAFFLQLRYMRAVPVLRLVFVCIGVAFVGAVARDAATVTWEGIGQASAHMLARVAYVVWSVAVVYLLGTDSVGLRFCQQLVPLHCIVTSASFLVFYVSSRGVEWLVSDRVWMGALVYPCILTPVTPGVRHISRAFAAVLMFAAWAVATVASGNTQLPERMVQALVLQAFMLAHSQRSEATSRRQYVMIQCIQSEAFRMERVLLEMVPPDYSHNLTHKGVADSNPLIPYNQMTVLYSDIKGFTQFSSSKSPLKVLKILRTLFRRFDSRLLVHGIFKVETIGDAYVCMGLKPESVCQMALDMQAILAESIHSLEMRIGISTGPVFAGIVGTTRLRYHAWGLAMETANHVQERARPGKIAMDMDTCALVCANFLCEVWCTSSSGHNKVRKSIMGPERAESRRAGGAEANDANSEPPLEGDRAGRRAGEDGEAAGGGREEERAREGEGEGEAEAKAKAEGGAMEQREARKGCGEEEEEGGGGGAGEAEQSVQNDNGKAEGGGEREGGQHSKSRSSGHSGKRARHGSSDAGGGRGKSRSSKVDIDHESQHNTDHEIARMLASGVDLPAVTVRTPEMELQEVVPMEGGMRQGSMQRLSEEGEGGGGGRGEAQAQEEEGEGEGGEEGSPAVRIHIERVSPGLGQRRGSDFSVWSMGRAATALEDSPIPPPPPVDNESPRSSQPRLSMGPPAPLLLPPDSRIERVDGKEYTVLSLLNLVGRKWVGRLELDWDEEDVEQVVLVQRGADAQEGGL